ncbi:hypothetical protein C8R42DRAFT_117973 [Lentinula raphanica]|nr:hypothetical protein C8R42DRAFT_117973 [Lentinula raphanica]
MPGFLSNIFSRSSCSNNTSSSRARASSSAASIFSCDSSVTLIDSKTSNYDGAKKQGLQNPLLSDSVTQPDFRTRNAIGRSWPNDSNSDTTDPRGPPPPYVARVQGSDLTDYRRPITRKGLKENVYYEILKKFNTVILVDDSFSMYGEHWKEAGDALSKVADIGNEFDQDGIDIYFLNNQESGRNLKTSEQVISLFERVRPSGGTYLGQRLNCLLRDYLDELTEAKQAGKKIKPINYLVITDGKPEDELDLEKSIVDVARRLDEGNYPSTQVGIQLVQVGRSRKATAFLKELDDTLESKYKVRDIVDTTPYYGEALSPDALIKIMLGGIVRKIDKTKVQLRGTPSKV